MELYGLTAHIEVGPSLIFMCLIMACIMLAVFLKVSIYDKKIFKLHEHIQRLFKSAELLDLNISYEIDKIININLELIEKQKIVNGYIRPVVWRGSEKMAISAKEGSTNIAIAAWEWPSYFSPEQQNKGVNLTVSKWKRPSPESAPTDSKAAGLYMICSPKQT